MNVSNQIVPIERSLWSGGKYFIDNPDKVGGKLFDTTNKFGEAVKETKGTVADVYAIMPEPAPFVNNWLVTPINVTPPQKAPNRAAEAIKATAKVTKAGPPATQQLDLMSFDELRDRYGKGITDDEYRIWANYQKGRLMSATVVMQPGNGWSKYLTPISKAEYLQFIVRDLAAFDGREYVPAAVFYGGMVYDKLVEMASNKERIVAEIGEALYSSQVRKMESISPPKLRLTTPENERLTIKVHDPFWKDYEISELADGTVFEAPKDIIFAFENWVLTLPKNDFKNGSNSNDVVKYAINDYRFPKDTPESVRNQRRRLAQLDMNQLFSRYLSEMLTGADQQLIEIQWNREFNGWCEYDFNSIPIGFEMNRWFKSGPIDPRKALWDGVRFMLMNGSGVIAFDVGVGKTMTAILALAQAMYMGQCKRPLVVVPDATYEKWISECVGEFNPDGTTKVHGVLPQFKDRINNWYNLGKGYGDGIITPPEDGTITFVTFYALQKMGLSRSVQDELGREMVTILSQGLDGRDIEKLREKIDEYMGDATSGTVVNFDEMGFDYLIFDEAHNAKKVFTEVKGDLPKDDEDAAEKKRDKRGYAITAGTPTMIGIKTFLLSQYIMRRNKMRNICLLTATPFTNSPLEIYSMLAMVAYQSLEKRGINNIKAFFDKFVLESSDMVVTSRGKFETKAIIKGFSNRTVLQNVVFSYMLHKTGEEANVKRPVKVVYPRMRNDKGIVLPENAQVGTALPATALQSHWIKQIALFANDQRSELDSFVGSHYYDQDGKIPGRDLLAVSLGRQVTLSPYLLRLSDGTVKNQNPVYVLGEANPSADDFFESSPKIQYAVGCIATIKQWHDSRKEPMSGIVIYMNQGVDYTPLVADLLVSKVGLTRKEVEVIAGGISQTKKEGIKKRFLDGQVKVIIGSSTIKEGIDLQNKSTTLFNLTLDWNPTDIQQLEGRIWRQGNQHSHVRIVTPLIENSVDVFMFQKLEEKTSRINSIWYRAGRTNVLDVDSFDPRELKLGLMTDPEERARVEVNDEVQQVQQKLEILQEQQKQLSEAVQQISDSQEGMETIRRNLEIALPFVKDELWQAKQMLAQDYYDRKADKERDERTVKALEQMIPRADELPVMFAIIKRYARNQIAKMNYGTWRYSQMINNCDEVDKIMKSLARLQKNVLAQHDITYTDDLTPLIAQYDKDIEFFEAEKLRLKSPQYMQEVVDKLTAERAAANASQKSVTQRIEQFTTHNHLLSCLQDVHDCDIDELIIKPIGKKAPTKVIDMPPTATPAPADDKMKRIRTAQALALAVKIKMNLKTAA
jgi:superfamily II DNA or RNA helicase